MARQKKGTRITASLPDRDHTELLAMAEHNDVSLSWLARQAITEFLGRYRDASVQLPLHLTATRKAANGN